MAADLMGLGAEYGVLWLAATLVLVLTILAAGAWLEHKWDA